MCTMVLMIGIQGSGKTEFCRRYLAEGYVHVSLDALKTRKNEQRAITECFADRTDFVVDNTNPTRADRARYIA